MTLSRRTLLKSAAAVGALTASAEVFAPTIAQNKPVRIGILAPRSGIAAAPGENGIRATQWAVERFNAGGGIAGRKVELVIEAAHNDYAARSMRLLQGLSRRFWYMHYREAADLPLCARLHANQARAIAKGDADAAGRASDKLMHYVESFTRATVSV